MTFRHWLTLAATAAGLFGVAGTAQAAFQGRDATGAVSDTCTATGPNRCTYFYDTTLDITILNNWNIGQGFWSASAAPGSAQSFAASAGLQASGLSGWVLPTGDGSVAAGPENQYLSIWNSVGGSLSGLEDQFHGARAGAYFSSSVGPVPDTAWTIFSPTGFQRAGGGTAFAVAVRSGDVAHVPEPQTYALMSMGVAAVMLALRRRQR